MAVAPAVMADGGAADGDTAKASRHAMVGGRIEGSATAASLAEGATAGTPPPTVVGGWGAACITRRRRSKSLNEKQRRGWRGGQPAPRLVCLGRQRASDGALWLVDPREGVKGARSSCEGAAVAAHGPSWEICNGGGGEGGAGVDGWWLIFSADMGGERANATARPCKWSPHNTHRVWVVTSA